MKNAQRGKEWFQRLSVKRHLIARGNATLDNDAAMNMDMLDELKSHH